MQKWRCTICAYIYDPAEGDIENGVTPGTTFKELTVEWECPRCGVKKSLFERVWGHYGMPIKSVGCTG